MEYILFVNADGELCLRLETWDVLVYGLFWNSSLCKNNVPVHNVVDFLVLNLKRTE